MSAYNHMPKPSLLWLAVGLSISGTKAADTGVCVGIYTGMGADERMNGKPV